MRDNNYQYIVFLYFTVVLFNQFNHLMTGSIRTDPLCGALNVKKKRLHISF